MSYVDGFVLAVPKARLEDYKAMAARAGALWMANGATSYVECIGDDLPYGQLTSFPRAVMVEPDEVVVFSWITYPSKAIRDACMAVIMADPGMKADMESVPFDGKRMIFGGFEAFLEL